MVVKCIECEQHKCNKCDELITINQAFLKDILYICEECYEEKKEDYFKCEYCYNIFNKEDESETCFDDYDTRVCKECESEFIQDCKDMESTQKEIESDYWRSR